MSDPKIIIDSDWKAQAQAEKEKLASQAKPAANPQSQGQPADEDAGPVSIKDLVSLLATQALSYMGAFPDPRTGKSVVALDYAKLHIDMLGVVEEKTKGNLDPEEASIVTRAVSELRMEYVELVKAVEKAVAEGKIKPQAVGASGLSPQGAPAPKSPNMGGIIAP